MHRNTYIVNMQQYIMIGIHRHGRACRDPPEFGQLADKESLRLDLLWRAF